MSKNTLYPENALWRFDSSENKLVSENGLYELVLQKEDGNLVLYETKTKKPLFATCTNSANSKIDVAKFQGDGNFVLYEEEVKNSRWSSNTQHTGAVKLRLENTGAIVLYDKNDKIINVINRGKWMSVLDNSLTLKQTCMPGSHDAGMYESKILAARGIALTQNKNIFDQLIEGIRYFDLRPRFINDKGYYVFHGGADGPKLDDILKDVKNFILNNPSEVVILNFSHYKDFENKNDDFINYLISYFDTLLRLQLNYNSKVELEPLINLRGKVLIRLEDKNDNESENKIYEDSVVKRNIKGFFGKHNELCIYDDYSDKKTYVEMIIDQMGKFGQFNSQNLFLLNWTLTPTTGNIMPWESSVNDYAKDINPKLTDYGHAKDFLFQPNFYGNIVNIINGDYWDICPEKVLLACFQVMNNRQIDRKKDAYSIKSHASSTDERLTMNFFTKKNEFCTNVVGQTFKNFINQIWYKKHVENDVYKFQNAGTGLYLSYIWGEGFEKVNIIFYSFIKKCDLAYGVLENSHAEAHQWHLEYLQNTTHRIISRKEKKENFPDRLDLRDYKAYLNTYNDGNWQKWDIIKL